VTIDGESEEGSLPLSQEECGYQSEEDDSVVWVWGAGARAARWNRYDTLASRMIEEAYQRRENGGFEDQVQLCTAAATYWVQHTGFL
jgi:hypothetical protein